jgi:NAD(P)-dependent dehydrogenase (short-subunit alcohol dehydrogenase family)
MQELPAGGAMVVLEATEHEVAEMLTDQVSIAAVNGPATTTISGSLDAVMAIQRHFSQRGRKTKRLRVSHAFHSPLMDPMLADFRRVAEQLDFQPAKIPVISNVTGRAVTNELCSADYWVKHARQTVRFWDGLQWLRSRDVDAYLEIGPDPVLSAHVVDHMGESIAFPVLRPGQDGPETLTHALAGIYRRGASVRWQSMLADKEYQHVPLPTYPFERQAYWLKKEPPQAPGTTSGSDQEKDQLWAAVDRGDVAGFSALLNIDPRDPVSPQAVLEALASRWMPQKKTEAGKWRYRIVWERIPDPVGHALPARWAVVLPEQLAADKFAESVIDSLSGYGAQVITVHASLTGTGCDREALGDSIRRALGRHGPGERRHGPGEQGVAGPATGVLSLLALDPRDDAAPAGLTRTLALIDGMAAAGVAAPLWSITRGAIAVQDSDGCADPGQAAVWGAGLAGSGPDGPWCGFIDLPGSLDEKAAGRLVAALARPGDGDGIAVRPYGAFARRLVRGWPGHAGRPVPWHPGGTVLVTNGADGLGVKVARWLASQGAPHVLLANASCADMSAIADLRARGVRVSAAQCDATDRAALARLIIETSAGQLTAVIHTSAVAAGQLPGNACTEQIVQTVRERITELVNLDELTRDQDLTAFVVMAPFSPPGTPGAVSAEAVRSFADALGRARRMRGQAAAVVAVGVTRADLTDEALGQLLTTSIPGLVITDVRWVDLALRSPHPLVSEIAELRDAIEAAAGPDDAQRAGTADLRERLRQASRQQRERMLAELVRHQLAPLLGHESTAEVANDADFRDLGLSSLTALKLHRKITATSGIDFPVLAVIEYSNPTALAKYLADAFVMALDVESRQATQEMG